MSSRCRHPSVRDHLWRIFINLIDQKIDRQTYRQTPSSQTAPIVLRSHSLTVLVVVVSLWIIIVTTASTNINDGSLSLLL
jgi:hypothetical protein